MACELADASIRFPSMGVEIRPFSLTYESDIGKLDYAQAEVSRAAGELVGSRLFKTQPAIISFSGHQLARMVIEPDEVRLTSDRAMLRLRDPKVILNYGIVEGTYEKTTLGEVVRDILDAVDDPHDVITAVRFTNADESAVSESLEHRYDRVLTTVDRMYDAVSFGSNIAGRELAERVPKLGFLQFDDMLRDRAVIGVSRKIDSLRGVDVEEGGFDFEGVPPIDALLEVQETFGVESWVDGEGILYIGFPEAVGQPFVASVMPGGLKLRDYNIVENASPVTGVVGHGVYKTIPNPFEGAVEVAGNPNVQLRAEALWTDVKEGRVVTIETSKIDNPVHLVNTVERTLRREIARNASGELVFNPLSSSFTEYGNPFEVSLGDEIFVVGTEDGSCGKIIPNRIFSVYGIRHKISAQDGWMMDARVSQILSADAIDTRLLVVSTDSGEWVDASEYYSKLLGEDVDYLEIMSQYDD